MSLSKLVSLPILILITSLIACESDENNDSFFYVITEPTPTRGNIFTKVSVNGDFQELHEFDGVMVDGFISSNIFHYIVRGNGNEPSINSVDINSGELLKSVEYAGGYKAIMFSMVNEKPVTISTINSSKTMITIFDPEKLAVEDSHIFEFEYDYIIDMEHVGNKLFLATHNNIYLYSTDNWEKLGEVDITGYYLINLYQDERGNLMVHSSSEVLIVNTITLQIEEIFPAYIASAKYNSITYSPQEHKIYFLHDVAQPSIWPAMLGVLDLNSGEVTRGEFSIGGQDLKYVEDFKYILSAGEGFVKIYTTQGMHGSIGLGEGSGKVQFIKQY